MNKHNEYLDAFRLGMLVPFLMNPKEFDYMFFKPSKSNGMVGAFAFILGLLFFMAVARMAMGLSV